MDTVGLPNEGVDDQANQGRLVVGVRDALVRSWPCINKKRLDVVYMSADEKQESEERCSALSSRLES